MEKTLFFLFPTLFLLLCPHLEASARPTKGFLAVGGLDIFFKLVPRILKKVWRPQTLLSSGPLMLFPVTFHLLHGICGRPQLMSWPVLHWRVTWWKS